MFRSVTFEKETGELTEERVRRDLKPPLLRTPPKPRRRLVRWIEWLVVLALVVGAGALGYVLLSGDDAEIRTDLLGTRYRETGVPMAIAPAAVVFGPAVPMYPADAAQLEAITSSYLSQIAEPELVIPMSLPDLSALTDSYFLQIVGVESGPAPDHGEGLGPVPGRYGGPL